MIPEVIIYYVRSESEKRPGEKIAKAAFVNVSDALIFWKALPESRKKFLSMQNLAGSPVTEITYTGYNDRNGYYAHAYLLTEYNQIPPRERDREAAVKNGWKFEEIK